MNIQRLVSRIRHTAANLGTRVTRVKRRSSVTPLGRSFPVRLVRRVIQELGEDDADSHGGQRKLLRLFSRCSPLLLGLSAIIGLAAQSPGRQQEVVEFIVDFLPGSERVCSRQHRGHRKAPGSARHLLHIGPAVGGQRCLWRHNPCGQPCLGRAPKSALLQEQTEATSHGHWGGCSLCPLRWQSPVFSSGRRPSKSGAGR